MATTRPPPTNNDARQNEDPQQQQQQDGVEDGHQQTQPRPQQNQHVLQTPSHSVAANTDFTNTPTFSHRMTQQQPQPNTPLACPPPVNDPDQRLRGFIEYERGAMAWQNRPDDLDAIEAWLQYHRVDIEDIKDITETRWVDSWQLKLGDLYRIKRDVQTFKIFAAR